MQNFFKKFVAAISTNEDEARKEFILNVLLLSIIVLSFFAFAISLIGHFIDGLNASIPTGIIFVILSFFVFLYFLSRKGFSRLSSHLLLSVIFLEVTYQIYIFGVDLPVSLLAYALIIIMAGILVSTRLAFFVVIFIGLATTIIAYFQNIGVIKPDRYWIYEIWSIADAVIVFLVFSIIATVSWLSNREIEKSLARARRSEAELKKERDSLEITVETRTRELKETQAEKMTQLYRFAEFGRLSASLFHDLINPLTAVSLNIEKIKDLEQNIGPHIEFAMQNTDIAPISETVAYIDKAIFAAKKMEDMVITVRKQLSRQEIKTNFSLKEEIKSAIEVLSHKARKAGVVMRLFSREDLNPVRSSRGALDHTFAETNGHSSSRQVAEHSASNGIKTYGDAVKFNQVALNLIANAIDSYLPVRSSDVLVGAKEGLEKRNGETRTVTMSLSQEGGVIIFEVKDNGIGISAENKPKLFEPFFTTKEEGYGLGIGLSMTKRIIEKDFGGSISVESKKGGGSVFTVKFPQKDKESTTG